MTELNPTVGTSIPRIDGVAKVTGAARYVDDIAIQGTLHGATVRSTVAHGMLRGIHLDPDFDWTDITVVTAQDIPGENVIALIVDDQPALVPLGGRIRHVDEPVALVAAGSRRLAREAAQHIRLDIEEVNAVFDAEEAARGGVWVHGHDNVLKRLEIHKGGDIEQAMAACTHVIEGTYRTGAQEQMYIEPQGMLAWFEGDACHVTGSLQCPFYIHAALKRLFALEDADVVIKQAVTGGGFGGKEEYPSMIAAHAALLARKAGRPVKLIYDRDEDIAVTTKRHPSVVRHRLGLNSDGTIGAIDVDVILDGGAYVTLTPVVLSRAVLHAPGPYRCDHVRVIGRAIATNTPPHGAFRGFGAPQTTFAYERQCQKAARRLGIEPFVFRRLNMLREGDTTATGQVLSKSLGGPEVLEKVEAAAKQAHESRDSRSANPRSRRRGRGLAYYFHGAGFTGSGEARLKGMATIALLPDATFEVRAGSTDIGQGSLTTFAQMAADGLGVDIAHIRIAEPDTSRVPDSGPTVASRTCMIVGLLVKNLAQEMRRHLVDRWGPEHDMKGRELLEIAAAHIREEPGTDDFSISTFYKPPKGVEWDDDTYQGSAYPVYGWAACLVDVAVDSDTYEVTVERCIHAVDVGKAIHPIIVKGQIEGGTLQALGWALLEHVAYKDGRVLNRTMTDCIVPTSFDAPEMGTIIVESPYEVGPFGAKGVGEIPMDGPAAAVAGAVEDALGMSIDALPILPERIEAAIRRAGESTS